MLLHGLGRFREATIRGSPTTDEEHPMLHKQREELGVDLTQDAPGLGATGLVDPARALPQLKQQFDVPSGASQH